MKKQLRNIIFICASILFYMGWVNGGESAYGKIVVTGINQFIAPITKLEKAELISTNENNKSKLYFTYSDRRNNISLEYCLPIVLLLAWQLSLFFDKRINARFAFKQLSINSIIIYFLQLIFPLLLFNISQSKGKSITLFIGLQIFSFLVFFLILKDSLIIRSKFKTEADQQ